VLEIETRVVGTVYEVVERSGATVFIMENVAELFRSIELGRIRRRAKSLASKRLRGLERRRLRRASDASQDVYRGLEDRVCGRTHISP
jgi:hypothetical protein